MVPRQLTAKTGTHGLHKALTSQYTLSPGRRELDEREAPNNTQGKRGPNSNGNGVGGDTFLYFSILPVGNNDIII